MKSSSSFYIQITSSQTAFNAGGTILLRSLAHLSRILFSVIFGLLSVYAVEAFPRMVFRIHKISSYSFQEHLNFIKWPAKYFRKHASYGHTHVSLKSHIGHAHIS